MAHFTFDERQIEQLYLGCKSHHKDLLKLQRDATAARLSTPAMAEITEQIRCNTDLRMVLNPRAEEEARDAARRKRGDRRDPRQLEIPVEVGGRKAERADASPNGKHSKKAQPAKRMSTATVVDGLDVANPEKTQEPTDDLLSRRLWEVCGLTVGVDVIGKWTSSEHEAANRYVDGVHERAAAITAGQPAGMPPEPPSCIWNQMWRGKYQYNPRGSKLAIDMPAKEREYWADQGPFTIRKDGSGSQSKFFVGGILDGELQEIEVLDKQGLSRMKDSAIVHAARLNQQFRGRALVGGEQFATQWVMKSLKHPGSGARYVQPAHAPNVTATAEATP